MEVKETVKKRWWVHCGCCTSIKPKKTNGFSVVGQTSVSHRPVFGTSTISNSADVTENWLQLDSMWMATTTIQLERVGPSTIQIVVVVVVVGKWKGYGKTGLVTIWPPIYQFGKENISFLLFTLFQSRNQILSQWARISDGNEPNIPAL